MRKIGPISNLLLLALLGCATSPAPQIVSTRNTALEQARNRPELEAAIEQTQNPIERHYLLAQLAERTGRPNDAFEHYLFVMDHGHAGQDETLLISAAMSLVAIRTRVNHFWERIDPLLKTVFEDGTRLPLESVFRLRQLFFARALHRGFSTLAKRRHQTGCITDWALVTPHTQNNQVAFPTCTVGLQPFGPAGYHQLVARTKISIPKNGRYLIRLETRGDATVSIDGHQLIARRQTDRWPAAVQWWHATLFPGVLPVEVRVNDPGATANFSLVILDEQTRPVQTLPNWRPAFGGGSVKASRVPESIPPQNLAQLLATLHVASWTEAPLVAHRAAIMLPPKNPLALAALASWALESPFVAQEIGSELAANRYRTLLAQLPDATEAARFLARKTAAEGHPEEAKQILDQCAEKAPNDPDLIQALLDICRVEHWDDCVTNNARKLASLTDASCRSDLVAYELAAENDQLQKARILAKRLSSCDRYRTPLSNELTRRGSFNTQSRLAKSLVETPLNDPALLLEAVDSFLRAGDEPSAMALLKQGAAAFAANEQIQKRLVNLALATGKEDLAKQTLDNALAVQPNLALETIRLDMGWSPLSPNRINGLAVIAAYQERPHHTTASKVWVLDRTVHQVHPHGGLTTLIHNIAQVHTNDAIADLGEVMVPPGATLLTLRTVKANGTIIVPDDTGNKGSISMPDLEPGDFVETEILQISPPDQLTPEGAITGRFFFRDFETFFDRTELFLIVPSDLEVTTLANGETPMPQDKTVGNWRIISYQGRHLAPLVPEPFGSEVRQLPNVAFAVNAPPAPFCQAVAQKLRRAARPAPTMTAWIDRLPKPWRDNPDAHRNLITRRLYQMVVKEIESDDPVFDDAAIAFSRKQGNRAIVLAALLKAAGLKSELALTRTSDLAGQNRLWPDINQWPVVLVRANGGMWLDPYLDATPYGALLPAERHQPLLRPQTCSIEQTGSGIVDPAPSTYEFELKLMDDGNVTGRLEITLRSATAIEWRTALASMTEAEQTSFIVEKLWDQMGPGSTFSDLAIKNLDQPEKPLLISMTAARIPILTKRETAGLLHLPCFWSTDRYRSITPKRQTPMIIDEEVNQQVTITLHLPPGATLAPPFNHKSAIAKELNATYAWSLNKTNDNTFTINIHTRIQAESVPANLAGVLSDFVQKVDANRNTPLTINF